MHGFEAVMPTFASILQVMLAQGIRSRQGHPSSTASWQYQHLVRDSTATGSMLLAFADSGAQEACHADPSPTGTHEDDPDFI